MTSEIINSSSSMLFKDFVRVANAIVADNNLEGEKALADSKPLLPEILFITSYPPKECGIATYSYDLIKTINEKFNESFSLTVCALETNGKQNDYGNEVKHILHTTMPEQYEQLAMELNANRNLKMIFIEHEFGLFGGEYGNFLLPFLSFINIPVITTFHTVLPNPDANRKKVVQAIAELSQSVVAMTKNSAQILENNYDILKEKISIIQHGTHLVSSFNNSDKKFNHYLKGRLVLTTFGLLSSGKSIETALDALPAIIQEFPDVIYLIIGKTHPGIVKQDGEKYREFLQEKVVELKLQNHVRFINEYLSIGDLLAYLQRTDIYLFTSKDPHQAVSGTFAYAMSCGCPIVSTPIPHAKEMMDGAGIIFDFQNSKQLATATIKLLADPALMYQMRMKALHKISPTSWQNSAIAHIELCMKHLAEKNISLKYSIPEISLTHIKKLTTATGMIQFSDIATPDIETGYTLDDNARALISVTKHFEITGDITDLSLIDTYLNFIILCQQPNGSFLNYVDHHGNFFEKNSNENLEDSNGRAVWALGEFISHHKLFHKNIIQKAENAIKKSLTHISTFHSPRAMAFAIKGLCFYELYKANIELRERIILMADNLVSKYRGVSDKNWQWFEEYLTYANSVLPEALLYAWLSTGNEIFKTIASSSFDFLLNHIFKNGKIKVVSNNGWQLKGMVSNNFGEQPIDVAYTILALSKFYSVFNEKRYLQKMNDAFTWFLGNNHLHQIIYNPCTGGCYDGLEEKHINLNQGAESTLSYLIARITNEENFNKHTIQQLKQKFNLA